MTDENSAQVQRIGLILIDGFALMSFASATEPLRAANLIAGRDIFRIETYCETGVAARASSGAMIPCQPLPRSGNGPAILFVVAGGDPREWDRPAIHACLRSLSREGVRLGGISGGPYVLAAAGQLAQRTFTIHWEHAPALVEAFPDLQPIPARYVIDSNRITCGGGIAPLDMMHALISERLGEDFARRVSDWFLHTDIAEPVAPQRGSLAERYKINHPALLSVLEKMEGTLERPLSRAAMSRFAGVTPRHLDRLFHDKLGQSFQKTYRRLRLDHAQRLLRQSALPISEIAMITGFSSPQHFATAFSAEFGRSPRAARQGGLADGAGEIPPAPAPADDGPDLASSKK